MSFFSQNAGSESAPHEWNYAIGYLFLNQQLDSSRFQLAATGELLSRYRVIHQQITYTHKLAMNRLQEKKITVYSLKEQKFVETEFLILFGTVMKLLDGVKASFSSISRETFQLNIQGVETDIEQIEFYWNAVLIESGIAFPIKKHTDPIAEVESDFQ